ncbi:hypothetical protein C7N43_10955 [Sphingobacteriales bacterium UPWRP_1]|nr:hypothetical protein B6N25_12685 [Sphingobacteriales bacterium TSM_CSS]PSJ76950.1 hypothetical protein C7N43_10955 [Sphingobacteriales bacterium UPWRP_1]
MEINFIRTEELIEKVISNPNKWIEAKLRFGNISATHFLIFSNEKLFDEGIDGEKREISSADFIKHYRTSFWQIDNIV